VPKIELRKGEDLEKALRKFKTKLRHEGILDDLKNREFYEKPNQRRRKEKKAAIRREERRRKEAE